MVVEARRRRAELVAERQQVESLLSQYPHHRLQEEWKKVAGELEEDAAEADSIYRGAPSQPIRVSTRGDLEQLISKVDAERQSGGPRAAELERRLDSVDRRMSDVQRAVVRIGMLQTRDDDRARQKLQRARERLEASKHADVAPLIAYHLRFLAGCPAEIDSLSSLNRLGQLVMEAKARDAGSWTLAILTDSYTQWQVAGFNRLLEGDFGRRLGRAAGAHKEALAGFEDNGGWRRAALGLSPLELEQLHLFLTKYSLDPEHIENYAETIRLAEDCRSEQGVMPGREHGMLIPVSAVIEARKTLLQDGAARAHHQEVFQHLNERGTIADVAVLTSFVSEDSRAYPSYWSPAVQQAYADYQVTQWWVFAEVRFDDSLFKALDAFLLNHLDADRTNRTAAAVRLTAEEVRAICSMLDDGVLSSGRLQRPYDVQSPDGSAISRLSGRFPHAKSIFEDLLWQKELAASKSPPPLAGENPFEPAHNANLDRAAAKYHEALVRHLNANKTLADIIAIKSIVSEESQSHPAFWQDHNLLNVYAELQGKQWAGFYNLKLKQNAQRLQIAYARRISNLAAWQRAARLWQPYAADMLVLLNGGYINSSFWLAAKQGIGSASIDIALDPAAWEEIRRSP